MRADSEAADELTVQQLRSFCVVFDKQSYSEAARSTGLSVPTIWEQVRKLEKRYSTVLFEKRGRRIQSTPAAELLYESLRPLLTGLEEWQDGQPDPGSYGSFRSSTSKHTSCLLPA